MTDRQRAFADYFLQCGNAAEAARMAGYSSRSARTTGARMLANADVRTFIAARREVLESERIADTGEVLAFLTAVMRGQIRDQFGLDPSLSDRLKAAQELIKREDRMNTGASAMDRLDAMLEEFRRTVAKKG